MIFCNKGEVMFRRGENKVERLTDLKNIMAACMNECDISTAEILSTLAAVLEEDLDGLEEE